MIITKYLPLTIKNIVRKARLKKLKIYLLKWKMGPEKRNTKFGP